MEHIWHTSCLCYRCHAWHSCHTWHTSRLCYRCHAWHRSHIWHRSNVWHKSHLWHIRQAWHVGPKEHWRHKAHMTQETHKSRMKQTAKRCWLTPIAQKTHKNGLNKFRKIWGKDTMSQARTYDTLVLFEPHNKPLMPWFLAKFATSALVSRPYLNSSNQRHLLVSFFSMSFTTARWGCHSKESGRMLLSVLTIFMAITFWNQIN